MIRNMIEKGLSISEIARELDIDRKTVRKYANSSEIPVKQNPRRGPSWKSFAGVYEGYFQRQENTGRHSYSCKSPRSD